MGKLKSMIGIEFTTRNICAIRGYRNDFILTAVAS